MVKGVLGYPKVSPVAISMPTYEDRIAYLLRDNMWGIHLKGCLEAISQGSYSYPLSINEFVSFVKSWFEQNSKNTCEILAAEQVHAELPKREYACCPKTKFHKHTVKDLAGRVRCAHSDKWGMKQGDMSVRKSYDKYSEMDNIQYVLHNWSEEKPVIEMHDICYAIISEKDYTISLEKVIKRLNTNPETYREYCKDGSNPPVCQIERRPEPNYCTGHSKPFPKVIFTKEHDQIAAIIKKWYEQENAQFFEKDRVL
jgi:hypothetical protein